MKKIQITTDSVADLPIEVVQKYDIKVMPFNVILGDETYYDGVNIQPQMIYEYVKANNKLPKTAAPGIGIYEEFFKEALKDAEQVIHFSISDHLSTALHSAKIACENVKNVSLVDTGALSTGIGLVVINACELALKGKGVAEIVEESKNLYPKVQTSFVVDSLDYLYKGGRCSGFSLFGANLLKIHPILQMMDGYLKMSKKIRGNMNIIFKKYFEYLSEKFPNARKDVAFITHTSSDDADVENMKNWAKEYFGFKQIYTNVAGSTITCHCGKNTLGLLFICE